MKDLSVTISMFNSELIVRPCVEAVLKVFPDPLIVDVGSEDDGVETINNLNLRIRKEGRLSGEEYTKLKEEITSSKKYALWIDADEIWPIHCLENIPKFLERYDIIVGWWKNLKIENGEVFASDYTGRGAVAWNTEKFRIHRTWPREKLSARDPNVNREGVQITPNGGGMFCWHGVLLNTSPLPDKKNRWKKRAERNDAFSKLEWEKISDLPFTYYDNRILETPKFVWYK